MARDDFVRDARMDDLEVRDLITVFANRPNSNKLTPDQVEGVVLGLLEGHTVADVAKSMKTSAYKVKKTFERLLEFVGRERE